MKRNTYLTMSLATCIALSLAASQAGAEEDRADDVAAHPNILLIVSDDLTCCLGAYGNQVCRTPSLNRLASQSVQFNHAYCQFPVCGPSRASLMSGLYPEQLEFMGNKYTPGSYRALNPKYADHPSIGGLLRRNGYVSIRVSKIFHMGIPANIETGSPGGDDPDSWDRSFNIMAPETASPGELETLSPKRTHFGSNFARVIVPSGREQTQADVLAASHAIAILESRARSRNFSDKRQLRPREPFFLAVGLVRPHVPSVAPQRLFNHYLEDQIKLPSVPENDLDDIPESAARMRNDLAFGMNDKQQRQAVAAYYATVEFMDEQVGRLLEALDRLNLRDHTVVIFTSDHGFHLGEHTLWQKTTLFEESTRVPLLISAPGFEDGGGKQSNALVELTDLYPTIVDLANQQAVAPDNLAGHSLVPILRDPESATLREFAYTVTGQGGRSIRSQDWRYNVWGDGAEELYDLKNDPKQFTNLADQPGHANALNLMREALQQRQTMLADENE